MTLLDVAVTLLTKYFLAVLAADGHWSAWSPWGQCSVSCGNGKKSRFRMCDNPPPMNGGDFCVGDPVDWTRCSSVCPGKFIKIFCYGLITLLFASQMEITCLTVFEYLNEIGELT